MHVQIAALLILSEAYVFRTPEQIVEDYFKDASVAISQGWPSSVHFEPHRVLAARRAETQPLAGLKFDPEAAARWVATGDSREGAA